MKKIAVFILSIIMVLAQTGCKSRQNPAEDASMGGSSQYETSLDVLNAVLEVYTKEDLFAMYGGDTEHAVMDAPGQFDISKTEELDLTLGLPESQSGNIDDAASMVHLMNGNTFTGAAWHLKDDADREAFADAVKANILRKQWLCGQPETLVIIQADGEYVITAYGAADIIETFKTNVLSAIDGAEAMTETPIA